MGGVSNGSLLCEVQEQARDQEPREDHHEERETCDSRDVPDLRNEDVQDREGVTRPGGLLAQYPSVLPSPVERNRSSARSGAASLAHPGQLLQVPGRPPVEVLRYYRSRRRRRAA